MNKVKFSEIAKGSIFWFKGYRMKKNKETTAFVIDKNGKHLEWTHMGINDICELEQHFGVEE